MIRDMIALINGKVEDVSASHIILENNGIGYSVFVPSFLIQKYSKSIGENIKLFTHHAIRENSSDLYGFETKEEKMFFDLLLTISGIGPKSALGILNTAPLSTLIEGIEKEDPSYLTKVSGIGKKSAEKIVLSLKDKIEEFKLLIPESANISSSSNSVNNNEAIEALTSLGYSLNDSREAIKKIKSEEDLSTQEIIKLALKNLN